MKTMRGFAMLKIGETGWVTKGIPACGPSDAICRPLALAPAHRMSTPCGLAPSASAIT